MRELLLEGFYTELERRWARLPASDRPVFGIEERLRCERAVRLGGGWSLFRLREALRACVVRSRAQDTAFDEAFEAAFGSHDEAELHRVEAPVVVQRPPGGREGNDRRGKGAKALTSRRRRGALLAAFLATAVAVLLAVPPWEASETKTEPTDESKPDVGTLATGQGGGSESGAGTGSVEPEPPVSDPVDPFAAWRGWHSPTRVEATFEPTPDRYAPVAWVLLGAAVALLVAGAAWWRRVEGERLPPKAPPSFDPQASLVPLRVERPLPRRELLDPTAADRLADAVGIVLDAPFRPDLDLPATLSETTRRAGLPSPILRPERHLQRVVVLGHTACTVRRERPVDVELAEKIEARGVPVEHAELRAGSLEVFPRVGTPSSLDRLHQNDAAAIVLVVAAPEVLDAALVRELKAFQRVAIVDPTDRVAGAAARGRSPLPVFCADAQGWGGLAAWLRKGTPPAEGVRAGLDLRPLPARVLEALGAGRELTAAEERELTRALGDALAWAAALACYPLAVDPGHAEAIRAALPGLARDVGESELAARVEALPPTAIDRIRAVVGTPPGGPIVLPEPLRVWLWRRVLQARWPALHTALLDQHVATLKAVEVGPGSQAAHDRALGLAVLEWWRAMASGDPARKREAARALRDARGSERVGADVVAWRDTLLPPPTGQDDAETRRWVQAAWQDGEWEPWTAGRRGARLVLPLAVLGLVGGALGWQGRERPDEIVVEMEGGDTESWTAWWADDALTVRDGPFTYAGLVPRPPANVSGTIRLRRVPVEAGEPCLVEEEGFTLVRCGPRGEFVRPTRGGVFRIAAVTEEMLDDPRTAAVLDWSFRAGMVQFVLQSPDPKTFRFGERDLGKFTPLAVDVDRYRLSVPSGVTEWFPELAFSTRQLLVHHGTALLTGVEDDGFRPLPYNTHALACVDGLGDATDCRCSSPTRTPPACSSTWGTSRSRQGSIASRSASGPGTPSVAPSRRRSSPSASRRGGRVPPPSAAVRPPPACASTLRRVSPRRWMAARGTGARRCSRRASTRSS